MIVTIERAQKGRKRLIIKAWNEKKIKRFIVISVSETI
jgi:hypothetical protein